MNNSSKKQSVCLLSQLDNMFSKQETVIYNFQAIVEHLQQRESFDPDEFAELYYTFFADALASVNRRQIECLYGFLRAKTNELEELYPYERLIGNIANLINQQLYRTIVESEEDDILLGKHNLKFAQGSHALQGKILAKVDSFLADIRINEQQRIVSYFKELISPLHPIILMLGNTDILFEIIKQMPVGSQLYFAELAPDCFGTAMYQMAKEFDGEFKIFLLADSAVAGLMPRFDAVVVNCRHVYKSGACELDPGALAIIEAANYYKKPVIVPVESAEVCKDDVQSEFLCFKHGNVLPGGDYCDGTLIDYYVMEQGLYSPASIFRWVDENL